jgi:Fe-S-cluster containining protein
MFVVKDILVSDEVLDAPFACNLGGCLGGCCVDGDSGAPLLPEERAELERALPRVRKYLRPEALQVIDTVGVWEETDPEEYATTCVDNRECVFVMYEGRVAKCALQKAYREGRIDFEKPISCHLYPIRISRYGDQEVINYESIPLCNPGRHYGSRKNVQLADFLKEPLVRKYGEEWYEEFCAAVRARRERMESSALAGTG